MYDAKYFEHVQLFFKVFRKKLKSKIELSVLAAFIQALQKKIDEEIEVCISDEELHDSTILNICLCIFQAVCENSALYKDFPEDLDKLLKDLCSKLLIASQKDSEINDIMLNLLKQHWTTTRSFCQCHQECLSNYVMKLDPKATHLDQALLGLLKAYCKGSKNWFSAIEAQSGRQQAETFRGNLVKQLYLLANGSIENGVEKRDNQKVVCGMMLLQSVLLTLSSSLSDDDIKQIIKKTNNTIGANMKYKNCAFNASLMVVFSAVTANPKIAVQTLHESFCLRTLLELLQANIATLTGHSYERKVIIHAMILLCKVLGETEGAGAKTGLNRFWLFAFSADLLHLHKILEEYEKIIKPKTKRKIADHVATEDYKGMDSIGLGMGADKASDEYLKNVVNSIIASTGKTKLTPFEKRFVPICSKLRSRLITMDVVDSQFKYDRPYEVEGLNELSLNQGEPDDEFLRNRGVGGDSDSEDGMSTSDYNNFNDFDYDVSFCPFIWMDKGIGCLERVSFCILLRFSNFLGSNSVVFDFNNFCFLTF